MKALFCKSPYLLEIGEEPTPVYTSGNTILQIRRIGICGTDLHAYEGTQPYFNYPRILGHEISADIVETDHNDFKKGEAVTFVPYFNCGHCIACRNNKPNCCATLKVCGVHINGGMAEYLSVPSYSLVKSQGLNYSELALTEPLAIGAHAIKRASLKEKEFVLVIGAGPIGLGIIEFARISGGNTIVMDINDKRLNFCKRKLHIEHIINVLKDSVMERLLHITNGEMPSVIIDATGNRIAINNAFQYLAYGGRYVLVGLQKGDINFSHPEFHQREATLMSSRNATREDFEFVIDCVKKGKIDPLKFVNHTTSFNNLENEFSSYLKPETGLIKVMVEM